MKHLILLTTIALVAVLNTPGAAQRSTAATYRLTETRAIEGTVVQVAFRVPDAFVHVEAPDQDGVMHRWSLLWSDGRGLGMHGVTRATLRVGDRVRVVGHPGRNSETYQLLVVRMTRAEDGWIWSNGSPDS